MILDLMEFVDVASWELPSSSDAVGVTSLSSPSADVEVDVSELPRSTFLSCSDAVFPDEGNGDEGEFLFLFPALTT
jgi:hypothetical protein